MIIPCECSVLRSEPSVADSITALQSQIDQLSSRQLATATQLDGRIANALSVARAADHSRTIEGLVRRLSDSINGSTEGFERLDARLDNLEDHCRDIRILLL